MSDLSQVTYCGGYSGGVPPLPIPNREVKPAIADGTAPPGGRVGSCRSSDPRTNDVGPGIFVYGLLPPAITLRPSAACVLRRPPPSPPREGSSRSAPSLLRFGRMMEEKNTDQAQKWSPEGESAPYATF